MKIKLAVFNAMIGWIYPFLDNVPILYPLKTTGVCRWHKMGGRPKMG